MVIGKVSFALIDMRTLTIRRVGTSDPDLLAYQVRTGSDDEQHMAVRELTKFFDMPDLIEVDPMSLDVIEKSTDEIVSRPIT